MNRCEIVLVDEYSKSGYIHSFYAIRENGLGYGQMSITDFQMEKPFPQVWRYLESLDICKRRRGQGLGSAAMDWLNMDLLAKNCHGALINGIIEVDYRNFYKKNGWKEFGRGNSWMFFNSQNLSNFCLRLVTEKISSYICQRN